MVLGVNEDCVIRTGRHASFAADADRFVEIDDAVRAFEHRGGRTGYDAGRVRALITARDLVRASRLWKHADVDVLDVGARDADGYDVFRLARCRARVTADAARVVDDLCPLNPLVVTWLLIDHVAEINAWRAL